MAMKDEYVGNDFPGYSAPQPQHGHEWLVIDRHVRGNGSMVDVTYVPRTCNHCDDAPCVKAGQGAVTKRPDGIVVIDPVKARGRRDLVQACPYGAVVWNEELELPQHWTFDAHLIDAGWTQPRCAQACASGAMSVAHVSDDEMRALAAQQNLTVAKPELGTSPRVYYRNMSLVTSEFVGGNVFARSPDGQADNVSNALVELTVEGDPQPRRAPTDAFGDFKFDGLDDRGARYTLRIEKPGAGTAQAAGTLDGSTYLGAIELQPFTRLSRI
ncbi:MAG: (4Fe-4S)-binding protein [Proteobacteria bacterium]|nr:(4Fe-4S)-binding protein [Pseudomonadota bacterium]